MPRDLPDKCLYFKEIPSYLALLPQETIEDGPRLLSQCDFAVIVFATSGYSPVLEANWEGPIQYPGKMVVEAIGRFGRLNAGVGTMNFWSQDT